MASKAETGSDRTRFCYAYAFSLVKESITININCLLGERDPEAFHIDPLVNAPPRRSPGPDFPPSTSKGQYTYTAHQPSSSSTSRAGRASQSQDISTSREQTEMSNDHPSSAARSETPPPSYDAI